MNADVDKITTNTAANKAILNVLVMNLHSFNEVTEIWDNIIIANL